MRALLNKLHQLRQNTDGAITVMMAGSLLMVMGAATVAVDLGSIYLAQRKLQGIADAAAMAAAQHTSTQLRPGAAQGIITQSREADIEIDSLENGTYTQDQSIPLDERFQLGGDDSAARVKLVQTVPLFFGKAIGFENATVRAQATAARLDMAAYSLGSSLASVSGGIPNALLGALLGTQINLSVLDTQSLANAQVDLLGLADALKLKVGGDNLTYAELLNTPIPLGDALSAITSTLSDSQAIGAIDTIVAAAPLVDVTLSDLLDLGPYGKLDYNPGSAGLKVDAYSLIRAMLELSHGDNFTLDFDLSAAGLTSVNVKLVRGYGMEHSPWLTVTAAKGYVLRTAQARLLLTARVGTGNALLPSLELPIYVDLAKAEATLDDIQCNGDLETDGVTLGVTPAIGTVGIGNASSSDLEDLSQPVTLSTATLLNVPLIARVTALSQVSLGGATDPQQVLFTMAEIEDQTTKTVATDDLTQSLATSLISQTELQAQTLGLVLNLSSVTSIVGNTLNIVAPVLDQTINSLTEALGVRLGAADVRVNKVRCGVPTIIA